MSSRQFDPRTRRRYGKPTLKPSKLVIDSPNYDLSKLNYFQYFPHRPRSFWVEKKSLVLSIDGACRGNHNRQIESRAAYGVYVGVCSPYNRFGRLDHHIQHTSSRAELEAAIQAIELVAQLQPVLHEQRTNKVILMMDSDYVYKTMTEYVWNWAKRDGLRPSGKAAAHWEAIKSLHDRIYELERKMDLRILFWWVNREDNYKADRLANLALDSADSAYGSS